jgi:AraC-like DNA-binding protein
MFRIIALLTPVFVSLFWAIILHTDRKSHSRPRSFLARLMLLMVVLFTVKFFNFEPLPEIYPYFDVIHMYAGCLIFPFYHIYFRLLTVDEKFSWKAHARYLILPTILVSIYGVATFLTPGIEFKTWLFNKQAFPNSPHVHFLNIMYPLLNYYVEFQVIFYVVRNSILLRRYGDRAEQFYSDINDGKYNNANILNYMIVINAVITIICFLIFLRYSWMVYIFPTIYAIYAYLIGYMGYKQKAINPTFDLLSDTQTKPGTEQVLPAVYNKLLQKLLTEFEENKIYLNSQLNILDVVQAVGTNRSYISSVINQQYNQNFCSFVNNFRLQELQRVYEENPEYTNESLAEYCGFGSVSSLRRSVHAKTGLSITEWKNQSISQQQVG